ncbi:MAG: WG repeat-containing protein [Bacteroidales bacterium]|nr:WG repeat-containing protein [Bacteroidales bacterium]
MAAVAAAPTRCDGLAVVDEVEVYQFLHHVDTATRRWGFVDKSGRWVIQPRYLDAYFFTDGLAPVEVEGSGGEDGTGLWGYVDNKGKVVIEPQFGYASDFSEGLASVTRGKYITDPWIYINKQGEQAVPREFRMAGYYSEGLAAVSAPNLGDREVYIDTKGNVVIRGDYSQAIGFSEGLAPVHVGYKWGFIDKKGKLVIEAKFDDVNGFHEGLARVYMYTDEDNAIRGYIDKNGRWVRSWPSDEWEDIYGDDEEYDYEEEPVNQD